MREYQFGSNKHLSVKIKYLLDIFNWVQRISSDPFFINFLHEYVTNDNLGKVTAGLAVCIIPSTCVWNEVARMMLKYFKVE